MEGWVKLGATILFSIGEAKIFLAAAVISAVVLYSMLRNANSASTGSIKRSRRREILVVGGLLLAMPPLILVGVGLLTEMAGANSTTGAEGWIMVFFIIAAIKPLAVTFWSGAILSAAAIFMYVFGLSPNHSLKADRPDGRRL